jgi:hypothetical protein
MAPHPQRAGGHGRRGEVGSKVIPSTSGLGQRRDDSDKDCHVHAMKLHVVVEATAARPQEQRDAGWMVML